MENLCIQLGWAVTAVVGLCTGSSCADPNASLIWDQVVAAWEHVPALCRHCSIFCEAAGVINWDSWGIQR